MSEDMKIRVILASAPSVTNTAGSVLTSWVLAQMEYRAWVREIEPDMLYHDPDGMR